MKSFLTTLIIVLFFKTSLAQNVKIENFSKPSDFEKALISFEGYVYYNFNFVSDSEKKLNFKILQKEFTKGKLVNEQVYFDSKTLPEVFLSNRIPFTILSKKVDEATYKLMFKFFESIISYRKFSTSQSESKSFKIFINQAQTFVLNQNYLLGGIIKPIKIGENLYRDCDFNSTLDKYQNWFEVFGLDHYIIFEIHFYQ